MTTFFILNCITSESLKRTSDIVCPDENQCAYRPLGNACVKRLQKYRDPVGSLKKTFKNYGRANLIFKNCNNHGFVKVLLNGIPIKAIARQDEAKFLESDDHYENDTRESVGKKKMEANFDVTPGDVLKLIEEGRAGIKVFSLTIDGKKFLCLIIYDQNVVIRSKHKQ